MPPPPPRASYLPSFLAPPRTYRTLAAMNVNIHQIEFRVCVAAARAFKYFSLFNTKAFSHFFFLRSRSLTHYTFIYAPRSHNVSAHARTHTHSILATLKAMRLIGKMVILIWSFVNGIFTHTQPTSVGRINSIFLKWTNVRMNICNLIETHGIFDEK